jgi:hypothetical protein
VWYIWVVRSLVAKVLVVPALRERAFFPSGSIRGRMRLISRLKRRMMFVPRS